MRKNILLFNIFFFCFIFLSFSLSANAEYIPTVSGSINGSDQIIYTGYGDTIAFEIFTDPIDIYDAASLDPDTLYKFDYSLIFNFDASYQDYQNYNFRLAELWYGDLYLSSGWDSGNQNFEFTTDSMTLVANGSVVAYGSQLSGKSYKFHIVTASDLYDAPSFAFDYDIFINRPGVESLESLTGSDSESYSDGYSQGFEIGQSSGYDSGYSAGYGIGFSRGESFGYNQGYAEGESSGYNSGFAQGESSGYNSGYVDGESSGYNSGYSEGFSDGQDSVDTESIYQSGFDAGQNSVDSDSYYDLGFQAGLDAGFQEAYDSGYDQGLKFGYSEGYNAAKLENDQLLDSSGSVAGDSWQINHRLDISKNVLAFTDSNTTLPFTFEYVYGDDYEFDYEREYENSDSEALYSDTEDYLSGEYTIDGYYYDPYGDISGVGSLGFEMDARTDYTYQQFGQTIDEIYFKELTKSYERWRGWSYYYTSPVKLFTADPSVYAYKIDLSLSNTSYVSNNINWARNIIGDWSSLMDGSCHIGLGYFDGSYGSFSYFVHTDNLPVDIYTATLFYFFNDENNSASYDLSSNLTFTITPYTRKEYAGIMSGMDDIKDDLNQNFNDLMHSYDDSTGNDMNSDFKASVTDYQTSETSLFNAAQDGLEGFEFVDFSSFPALVTSMSFVTSLMNSVYMYMGGETGPFGLVLSVLFSVMLVSMVIGLYRFYQNHKGG